MKSNDAMTSSYAPGLKSDERYHDAWARYLSKWFTSMKAYDVPFWGMTVQNEPEYAAPWEACLYTAEQQRDFVRDHLGPVLKKDHPEINIIIFDHNKDHVVESAHRADSGGFCCQSSCTDSENIIGMIGSTP